MSFHPWNRALWEALTADPERLPHALLLHGPEGVGKRQFTMSLAKWLLCAAPAADQGCGRCPSCGWFEQGGHPDFRLIEPAVESAETEADTEVKVAKKAAKKGGKHITIAEVRALGEFLSLAAHQGGWRVVVLHPAESMNAAAANALLKTLEEPPARVLIMLVAHQPRRLLPTVLSRCRKMAVKLPARKEALAWLAGEGLADAELLLSEAGGAPLLAQEYADAERLSRRQRFLDGVSQGAPVRLFELAYECQHRVAEAWGWFSRWIHDLIAVQATGQVRYFPEHTARLGQIAEKVSLSELLQLQQELSRAGRWLRHPLNGQLLLESWFLRYAEMLERGHGR